jgi:hypothetical protein
MAPLPQQTLVLQRAKYVTHMDEYGNHVQSLVGATQPTVHGDARAEKYGTLDPAEQSRAMRRTGTPKEFYLF